MALYPDPLDTIIANIATLDGVTLVKTEYTFGVPTPYADPSGVNNSQMVITSNPENAPYQGSVTVFYNRLDLADFGAILPQPVLCNSINQLSDFIALLNTYYGANFDPDNDLTGDVSGIDGTGNGQVVLTAQDGSIGWIGTVTITVAPGRYDLASAATVTALPGLAFPDNADGTKPFAETYSYWRDFTSVATDFAAITTATTDLTQVATDMTAVTGNAWSASAQGRYSLLNAVVEYNGVVSGYTGPTGETGNSTTFANLLVIQLDPTQSLGYSGRLMLHYGAATSDF